MRTILLAVFLPILVFTTFALPAHAQSDADIAAALERMDAIIAEMEKLRTEFSSLSATVNTTPSPTPTVLGVQTSGAKFTMPLVYGETNDDIKYIQSLLATDPEIYPYGVASGFFGPKTQEAIRNLQSHFGLDPVGVVGPATRAILEAFKTAYPTGAFPANVLQAVPTAPAPKPVVNDSVTAPTPSSPTPSVLNPILSIDADIDRGEAEVRIRYRNGESKRFIVTADNERKVAEAIARRTGDSLSNVLAALDVKGDSDDTDHDEDDAEDAIEDAEDAIDDADEEIDDADDDGEDVKRAKRLLRDAKDALEEAEDAFEDEDWDEAVEKAEEAKELAEDAEDAIGDDDSGEKGDSDDIEEIRAEVEDKNETNVTVEYEDGSEYEFDVEEDQRDEIIEEVADELDMDEDDVEDLIEFDYGDVESIDVLINEDEDEARVTIQFESGVRLRFIVDETDEDDIIEEIAALIDEDEDDIEDWADFDYS